VIIVFLGPPYSGKGVQAEALGERLQIPVFSMGALIREGYKRGDPKAVEGFRQYSLKGLHLPNSLKFHLLKEKLDQNKNGFILDNYPATQEDLDTFANYLSENSLQINKVFYINITVEEMKRRIVERGRRDDAPEILLARREKQDKDRIPVLDYFRQKRLLVEISGEGPVGDVQERILKELK